MKHPITRRRLIYKAGLILGGTLLTPKILRSKALCSKGIKEKRLNLHNIHTGESFNDIFWVEGEFIQTSYRALNKILRDWRTEEQILMCPSLLELMWDVSKKLKNEKPLEIVSGYRSIKTNTKLRSIKRGVALKSRHLTGHAVDFYIPGVRLKCIRNAALSFKKGGVGYYPKSGFVHIDIRRKPAIW